MTCHFHWGLRWCFGELLQQSVGQASVGGRSPTMRFPRAEARKTSFVCTMKFVSVTSMMLRANGGARVRQLAFHVRSKLLRAKRDVRSLAEFGVHSLESIRL